MKPDKTTVIILATLIGAGTLLAVIMVNIADRSEAHLREIKETKVQGSQDTLSIIPSSDEQKSFMTEFVRKHRNDATVTIKEIEFNQPSFAQLAQLTKVTRLNLFGSTFDNAWLQYLNEMKSLNATDLSSTSLNGEGLRHLTKMPITVICIGETDIHDDDLKFLPPTLTLIRLPRTKVTDKAFRELANLPNLTGIDLTGCDITGTELEQLLKLKHLNSLNLSHTRITDKEIAHLLNFKYPKLILHLSRTDLSQSRLAQLAAMKNVDTLYVDRCPNLNAQEVEKIRKKNAHCKIFDAYEDPSPF